MLPRATENAVAGHIWPAGRYLPTPDLGDVMTLNARRFKWELNSDGRPTHLSPKIICS